MVEVTTNITTGRVSLSSWASDVSVNLIRGLVTVVANSPTGGGGGGHSPSILMETSGYILMETSDTILLE